MSHNYTTRKLRSLCVKYYGKVTVEGVITTHLLRTWLKSRLWNLDLTLGPIVHHSKKSVLYVTTVTT
jgi:hypothetical protein